jgi:prepilin-type N-terminal cleavage/methylation domain-containing protein
MWYVKVASPLRWSGFTLIELLVVLFIISVLVGLLMPAVQHARESARQATCKNNLRQLSLAMHGCMEFRNKIPAPAPPDSVGGWAVAILPFLEQRAMADDFKNHPSLKSGEISTFATQRPLIMTCPSAYDGQSDIPPIPVANYILIFGSGKKEWWLGDAPWKYTAAWCVGPVMPRDYIINNKGPHNGGFHVTNWDMSVDFHPAQ